MQWQPVAVQQLMVQGSCCSPRCQSTAIARSALRAQQIQWQDIELETSAQGRPDSGQFYQGFKDDVAQQVEQAISTSALVRLVCQASPRQCVCAMSKGCIGASSPAPGTIQLRTLCVHPPSSFLLMQCSNIHEVRFTLPANRQANNVSEERLKTCGVAVVIPVHC